MDSGICNICGSGKYVGYLKIKDREIVLCKTCGTLRTRPYPEVDYGEQEFYCEHYLKNETLYRDFAKGIVLLVKRYKNSGRLLDIGCAVGFLLEEARKSGFKADGIELNVSAAEIAGSKGFSVKTKDSAITEYEDNAFDVITLNHILEHILDINEFLQNLKRVLRADGILLIGVPNHASLIAGLCKSNWYGWGIPNHIWHFDRNSLKDLMARNNFAIKNIIQNSQYHAFSKSFRKNLITFISRLGSIIGAGDQLIMIAAKI